jgi:phosphoglycerol transferase MdoB-like AlkP superfamily enzyme
MKEKLKAHLNSYLLILLAFLPGVFLIRLAEFLSLHFLHAVPGTTLIMELSGLLMDILVFLSFSLLFLVPHILVSLLNRLAGSILTWIVFIVYTLVSMSLVKYFTTALVLLDQVIFHFTPRELLMIIGSSTSFDLLELGAFFFIPCSSLIIFLFIRKIRLHQLFFSLLLAILLFSPVLMILSIPEQVNYQTDYEFFVRSSKTQYLANKILKYNTDKEATEVMDADFAAIVKRYHLNNPQFSFINDRYPLLRVDSTPDVLGSYFSFKKEKPNLVFIIVESMSASFCGDRAYYGSFMPFLDSLIGQSLYWSNFLSSAERTFNVMPAVFGSLPYCKNIFSVSPTPPLHFSMIRYLKENGYYTHFLYGGDPGFEGYENFMHHENIDYILNYFGSEYGNDIIREKNFVWGYPDGDLFKRSFEVMDSLNHSPRLDIYLTLSMHAPFTTPDEEHYRKKFRERLDVLKPPAHLKKVIEVQKNIFTTIVYTDQSLRTFFNEYRKRKEFENTIFIITGDHAMPELNYTYLNLLERYHVPFIIYSPLLKKPEYFESVSSHLDVTPSILAMLKNAGFISIRQQGHWLGKGIDVTKQFINTHKMSFVFNSGDQGDYIEGEYYLSCGRLFNLLPGLQDYFIRDSAKAKEMQGNLDDYLQVCNHIINLNQIIPEDLYFSGRYTESPYIIEKPVSFKKTRVNDYYISLAPTHRIRENFQLIRLDLSMVMEMKPADSLQIPFVIFQVLNDKAENIAWFQFKPEYQKNSGVKNRVTIQKYIDLTTFGGLQSKTLKIYISNPDKKEIFLDDLKLTMTGYKDIRQFIPK